MHECALESELDTTQTHTHSQQTLPTSSNDESSQVIKKYLLSTCFGVRGGTGVSAGHGPCSWKVDSLSGNREVAKIHVHGGGGAKGKQSDQDVTETGCLGSDSVSALAPMGIQSWVRVSHHSWSPVSLLSP